MFLRIFLTKHALTETKIDFVKIFKIDFKK